MKQSQMIHIFVTKLTIHFNKWTNVAKQFLSDICKLLKNVFYYSENLTFQWSLANLTPNSQHSHSQLEGAFIKTFFWFLLIKYEFVAKL
jgi:hypothetical protein